ncbi:PPE family protein [Candidatus Mycobacterium wuenschmannii]|uniref:PPE family protein n=1 Tax=Candidatus Mycobacterium wuenschmannii TaxID=3027808 RepID=A0ABY8VYL0_9MYCO|nr:PPE family protein [Candidatus Mycobacterium wuenschmannii]WIM88181.1 PPE family protein [Candidatus Mycobacterium wuenschmannii]
MPTLTITPKPTPVGFAVRTATAAASHSESFLIADFGSIPPEINSTRMYTGPGSEPLLRAAAMWDALSSDLYAAAGLHQSVASQLTSESWLGPASATMMDATTPHLTWLHDTAALAARTAQHARAAATAYDAARAMTVPPSVVAANRAQLATIAAANTVGLHAHAIAEIDAQYREMWAQDSTAMYMYADTSANAANMIPFLPPPGVVGDVARAQSSSGIVQALRSLASPVRMGASTPSSLTGALAMLKPLGRSGTGAVARVATTASVGKGASVGVLSVPREWYSTASVRGSAAPAAGVWSATPINATPAVPMMPATRTPTSSLAGYLPASRSRLRTVISMRSGA